MVSKPPINEIDRVVIQGVNHNDIQYSDKIISTTSSTTQVLALMMKILDESFGVDRAMMTTVHAYTSDQPLADAVRSDLRRRSSAVENIIPNQTQAPQLVETIMPHYKGKIEGIAFNVPIPDGSCVDLTTQLQIIPSVQDVNALMKDISENSKPTIIGYTDDPIVSSDVVGDSHSMIFDARATMIASEKLLKTLCWYDDGYGYSQRILELTKAYNDLEKTA
mgnify:CR=1 FL=1